MCPPPDKPIYFGKGVPVAHWPRFVFYGEWGDHVRDQTRQERRAQGKAAQVKMIL